MRESTSTVERDLDAKFAALAHPVRRQIVARLADRPLTLKELAEPCAMTVPAVAKHVNILADAGLVHKGPRSSTRPLSTVPGALDDVAGWLERQRAFWEGGFDRLHALLAREAH